MLRRPTLLLSLFVLAFFGAASAQVCHNLNILLQLQGLYSDKYVVRHGHPASNFMKNTHQHKTFVVDQMKDIQYFYIINTNFHLTVRMAGEWGFSLIGQQC